MRRYTRRLFSQAISGAIVSLPMVNSLLRGDEPPRPLINAYICVYAQGRDEKGNLVASDKFCSDGFDPSVTPCNQVYLDLDSKAVNDLKAKYPLIELYWVVVVQNTGCPDIVIDEQPEGFDLKTTGKHSCSKPRWHAVVTCLQCDGGHRSGHGFGLTRAGARIRAQRKLEKKMCSAKTKCATKRQVIVIRVNDTNTCCD